MDPCSGKNSVRGAMQNHLQRHSECDGSAADMVVRPACWASMEGLFEC